MNKKNCEQIRKSLGKYLRGHVFATERTRIERHLSQCVICRSEFESIKRKEETKQLLRDIQASEGVVESVRSGVSALKKVKKVFYRPLWIVLILSAAAALYYYSVKPRQLDLEIESIVKSAPTVSSAATSTVPATKEAKVVVPSGSNAGHRQHQAEPKPTPEPLIVTLTPIDDTEAVDRINEILARHGQLRNMAFNNKVKEISGTLTAKELATFFDRVASSAKVRYSRKQMASFDPALSVPFVLKLKAAPKPEPVVEPETPPEEKPAPAPEETAAKSDPTSSTVQ